MRKPDERDIELARKIMEACSRAGLMLRKTENNKENLGMRAELALAMQLRSEQ